MPSKPNHLLCLFTGKFRSLPTEDGGGGGGSGVVGGNTDGRLFLESYF